MNNRILNIRLMADSPPQHCLLSPSFPFPFFSFSVFPSLAGYLWADSRNIRAHLHSGSTVVQVLNCHSQYMSPPSQWINSGSSVELPLTIFEPTFTVDQQWFKVELPLTTFEPTFTVDQQWFNYWTATHNIWAHLHSGSTVVQVLNCHSQHSSPPSQWINSGSSVELPLTIFEPTFTVDQQWFKCWTATHNIWAHLHSGSTVVQVLNCHSQYSSPPSQWINSGSSVELPLTIFEPTFTVDQQWFKCWTATHNIRAHLHSGSTVVQVLNCHSQYHSTHQMAFYRMILQSALK